MGGGPEMAVRGLTIWGREGKHKGLLTCLCNKKSQGPWVFKAVRCRRKNTTAESWVLPFCCSPALQAGCAPLSPDAICKLHLYRKINFSVTVKEYYRCLL